MGKKTITFVIDNDNAITSYESRKEAEAAGEGSPFSSREQLDQVLANCTAARLLDIWNGIPGVEPTKKFTSRAVAIGRIWKAIQALSPEPAAAETAAVTPPAADVASIKPRAARKAKEPKKPRVAAEQPDNEPRDSKKAQVLAMMREPGGAKLEAIIKATGWQAHTIRGFMATVPKKLGLTVVSAKVDGERSYSIQASEASHA